MLRHHVADAPHIIHDSRQVVFTNAALERSHLCCLAHQASFKLNVCTCVDTGADNDGVEEVQSQPAKGAAKASKKPILPDSVKAISKVTRLGISHSAYTLPCHGSAIQHACKQVTAKPCPSYEGS